MFRSGCRSGFCGVALSKTPHFLSFYISKAHYQKKINKYALFKKY